MGGEIFAPGATTVEEYVLKRGVREGEEGKGKEEDQVAQACASRGAASRSVKMVPLEKRTGRQTA